MKPKPLDVIFFMLCYDALIHCFEVATCNLSFSVYRNSNLLLATIFGSCLFYCQEYNSSWSYLHSPSEFVAMAFEAVG